MVHTHIRARTHRDGKRSKGLSRDERRRLTEAGRRAARSEVVRALAAEVTGAPEEERYALPGLDRWVGARVRPCVCVCVCAHVLLRMCVCVCVCKGKRE